MPLLDQIDDLIKEAQAPHEFWDQFESSRLHFNMVLNDPKQEKRVIKHLTKLGMVLCGDHYDDNNIKSLIWGCTLEELIKFREVLKNNL
jgi:hypothetical protein